MSLASSSSQSVFAHRLGFLGLGEARLINRAIGTSPHRELDNLCDLDAELCRERSKEAGSALWTTHYKEMLAEALSRGGLLQMMDCEG